MPVGACGGGTMGHVSSLPGYKPIKCLGRPHGGCAALRTTQRRRGGGERMRRESVGNGTRERVAPHPQHRPRNARHDEGSGEQRLSLFLDRAPRLPERPRAGWLHDVVVMAPNSCSRQVDHETQKYQSTKGEVLALRGHCVHTAHAEAGILTQVIRSVVTVLFPRNPFQKNGQSKNI